MLQSTLLVISPNGHVESVPYSVALQVASLKVLQLAAVAAVATVALLSTVAVAEKYQAREYREPSTAQRDIISAIFRSGIFCGYF